jgi:hypothetical protein
LVKIAMNVDALTEEEHHEDDHENESQAAPAVGVGVALFAGGP